MRAQSIALSACLLLVGACVGRFPGTAQPAATPAAIPATTLVKTPATTPGTAAVAQNDPPGKATYYRICVNCHGEPTEGGDGPALVPMFHDPQEVLGIVRQGQAKMLPISREKVTDAQVLAVVDYLTQLTEQK